MGRKRTILSKRRQRQRQKQRKITTRSIVILGKKRPPLADIPIVPVHSTAADGDSFIPGNLQADKVLIDDSTYEQPSVLDDCLIDEQDSGMTEKIDQLPLQEQRDAYKNLFTKRTERMHFFMERVDEQDLEIQRLSKKYKVMAERLKYFKEQNQMSTTTLDTISRDCRRKIQNIRQFWKGKIYMEHSRSGKIVKKALLAMTLK
jgi:hypothetical protein